MNDIQKEIFNIFTEVKRICDKYRLTYFAIGGTCIGAVRHHGFIPWDDDIDIAMPIQDYVKFIEYAKKELRFPYSLYSPQDHPHWIRCFVKVQNTNTTFIEEDGNLYQDRMTGVNIDIMPIFGMPKSLLSQKWMILKNEVLHYMNRWIRIPYTGRRRYLNYFLGFVSKRLGNKNQDINYFYNKLICDFSVYKYDNSNRLLFGWRDKLGNRFGKFSYLVVADYEDFSDSIEVPFETGIIKIPKGYDHYLSSEFGDYMVLPPKEAQINHRPSIVDLKNSYLNYQDKEKRQ